jgi:hypothetical protein
VLAAARALQTQLCSRFGGLRAELLRRPDGDDRHDGEVTLMEVYAFTDAAQAAAVERAAADAMARWQRCPRQVEVFEAIG